MSDISVNQRIARRLHLYFNQLTIGCGKLNCKNTNCASSNLFRHENIDNNQAAAIALQNMTNNQPLCNDVASGTTEQPTTFIVPDQSTSLHTHQDAPRRRRIGLSIPSSLLVGTIATNYLESSTSPEPLISTATSTEDQDEEVGSVSSNFNSIATGLSGFLRQVSASPPPRNSLHNHSQSEELSDLQDFADFTALNTTLTSTSALSNEEITLQQFVARLSSTSTTPITQMNSQIGRIHGLTLDELTDCVESCRHGDRGWLPLTNLIEDVFSSLHALAASFSSTTVTEKPNKYLNTRRRRATSDSDISDVDTLALSRLNDDIEMTSDAKKTSADNFFGGSDLDEEKEDNENEKFVPMDMDETVKSYRLLLSLPYEANVVNCLTSTIFRLIVTRIRQIVLGTASSPPPSALKVEKPETGSRAEQMQLRLVNVFLILYACPLVTDPLYFEVILPVLCRATTWLPMHIQARICQIWAENAMLSSKNGKEEVDVWLLELQRILMQSITLRCLTMDPVVGAGVQTNTAPNEDRQVREAARTLRIVYYASLIAGGLDNKEQLKREAVETADVERQMPNTLATYSRHRQKLPPPEDPLGACLGVNPNDCRHPLIPASEFINETLNDAIEVKHDFICYRSSSNLTATTTSTMLSFMELPFLLQTTTKSVQLYYDNRLRMLEERRGAFLHSLLANDPEMPFFKLRVARERVVEDALVVLELTWMDNAADLKKQLYVEFDGEQGIDEGGLSKEFFMLIFQRIFNPDYGMFTYNEETQLFWFNPSPIEDLEREYCLIGCIVGLAIYNNIILDIQFPSLLYRKLVGKLGTVEDLQEGWPALYHGFMQMLAFEESESKFQEVFCSTFDVSYTDIFGRHVTKELLRNGSNKPVTMANRQEYVELTADYLLNTSVKSQFAAFRKGFNMVIHDSLLTFLFSPHEIELLVRGSQEYNFVELQRVTQYEGNFTSESPTIRNFWSVVHSLSDDKKRQLLQFTTGSDRIPLGGMAKLKFVIARQGPDSERLPTAHTCFNILLLPDYSTKEKLEQRLTTAIVYSKGFGMF